MKLSPKLAELSAYAQSKVYDLPVIKLPVVDVTTDPLDLLVAALALRMKQLSHTSPRFVELAYDRKFRIEIGVEEGIKRQIVVDHGKVSSDASCSEPADFRLQFASSELAVKTLLSGNPNAFMLGMQSGEIKMEGDFSLLVWFNQAAKLIPPKLPKPVQEKIKQVRNLIKQKKSK